MRGNRRTTESTIITALLAVLLISIALVKSGSGRAPQGGSGRGSTNNSGQPQKRSARPTIKVVSLAGTVWKVNSTNGSNYLSINVYKFLSGGKLKCDKELEGTWRQYGRRVVLVFAKIEFREEGTITGNQIRGTGTGPGVKYTLTAKRTQ